MHIMGLCRCLSRAGGRRVVSGRLLHSNATVNTLRHRKRCTRDGLSFIRGCTVTRGRYGRSLC